MKGTVENVVIDTIAPFGLPEAQVKFTAAEWQLLRKLIRVAREHMDVLESELPEEERLVYKQMVPVLVDIDDKISSKLKEIMEKHQNINMAVVKDFHRYDWTEELSQNVATEEELEELNKDDGGSQ